jgi:nucleoside-diphosphate-sugar epimerase
MADLSLNKKKVLITGANGFLGSHIVKKTIAQNADTTIIVRENSDLWRIEDELKFLNIYKTDIRNLESLSKCIETVKPDFVFHMAAYGVDSRQNDLYTAINSNLLGTVNLLNVLGKAGCEKFINTGTSMQYGNKEGMIDESTCYTPKNIYGSTKASATIMAHQIADNMGLDIVTIIPFGVFGEKEGSHKFFPQVILSVLNGKDVDLTLCEQCRDYCYVENIVDGFLMAAKAKHVKNEIFNIGSGVTHPLKYYVDLIIKEMNTNAKANYGILEYRKNDLWNPLPKVDKVKNILGWYPAIQIDEGIRRTISWYSYNYKKYEMRGR